MIRSLAAVATAMLCALVGVFPAGAAASHALIEGSGSSWAANAVNQWVADVNSQGIQVDYTPNGDAQGRQDYANRTSDFAVTALGYQGVDPVTGVSDTSQNRGYAYLPIAAGGTAFPYQIKVAGQQVRNLRLSGETLTKIFTNQITNWDDPEITADNNGVALPSLPITPVVQSEGSGATWQLTKYFDAQYKSIWESFSQGVGPTEYFPRAGTQIAQNGSDGAMNYVSSSAANGSIGYVEYSYALAQNYPVVKLGNSAGFFTLPTQFNVAVSLQKAVINMDKSSPNYLLQTLTNVYSDPDPRTYPLSSYVYMIVPTGKYPSPESKITTAKRQSIADFVYYSICQGQREIGPIGYSSLPVNLVQAGFGQLQKLQQADPKIDLTQRDVSTCDNPTFVKNQPSANYLAQIAPQPPACDKSGANPCAAGVTPIGVIPVSNPDNGDPAPTKSATATKSTGPAKSTTSSVSTTGVKSTALPSTALSSVPTASTSGHAKSTSTVPTASSSNAVVAPTDGQVQPSDAAPAAGASPQIVSAQLAGYRTSRLTTVLAPLAAVLLVLVLVLPPVIGLRVARRRGKRGNG